MLALTAWSLFDAVEDLAQRTGRGGPRPRSSAGPPFLACRSAWRPSMSLRSWPSAPGWRSNPDAPVGVEIPRRYHLWHLNAWQLLSPTALGGPSDYFGDDNYWETLFSIGLVPLFLAVVGAVRHPDRKLARGWLVLAGLADLAGLRAALVLLCPGIIARCPA